MPFGQDLHHRLGIFDDRFDLFAEHPSLGVDLFNGKQFGIVQRCLDNRDCAAERMQNTHLYSIAFRCLGDISYEMVGGNAAR